MRSAAELAFRLRQEAANLALLLGRPVLPKGAIAAKPFPFLPNGKAVAAALAHTSFRDEVRATAECILKHRFPLLGIEVDTGPQIHWRRDYIRQIETNPVYLRRIPYLNPDTAGDHKLIWELNRHQHLVLLAQEFLFSAEPRFLDELMVQLENWWRDNPPQRGINWTSALEVAFRAISWAWVWHYAGEALRPAFQERLATEIYRHGLHIEYNLSVYFSPNTHLLGEALCLFALGRMFPEFPRAAKWIRVAGAIVAEQMNRQVREDGSHFEQSAYYHLYAADMFLFYAVLGQPGSEFQKKLELMGDYLSHLTGGSGILPMMGDDDGGRFFHPYSKRERYARETLAAYGVYLNRSDWVFDGEDTHAIAAWWLGPEQASARAGTRVARSSRLFRDSGMAALFAESNQVLFDAGSFGPGTAGHSHADTLSILVRRASEEILIDPGTYTYVGDPVWRNRFRGTAMHNTIRINALDQATPGTPFSWKTRPVVRVCAFEIGSDKDTVEAECIYSGFTHCRRLVFLKPDLLFVMDTITGPAEECLIERFWHPGLITESLSPYCVRIGSFSMLVFESGVELNVYTGGEFGWRSPVFAVRETAAVIVARAKAILPARFITVLDCSDSGSPGRIDTELIGDQLRVTYSNGSSGRNASVLISNAIC